MKIYDGFQGFEHFAGHSRTKRRQLYHEFISSKTGLLNNVSHLNGVAIYDNRSHLVQPFLIILLNIGAKYSPNDEEDLSKDLFERTI